MHSGRHYTVKEVLFWTRREILALLLVACVPTLFYEILGCSWLSLPWVPIALIGTAVAFIVGFKKQRYLRPPMGGKKDMGGYCKQQP